MLVKGYAAIFDTPDKTGDVIVAGAFSDWIKSTGGVVTLPMYWMHDYNPRMGGKPTKAPIGVTTLIKQDTAGLYFEGDLAGFPKAAAIAELVAMGGANGSSIGYEPAEGGVSFRRSVSSLSASGVSVRGC